MFPNCNSYFNLEVFGNCGFEFHENFDLFSCPETLCCPPQLCPSSQTSPTAGLPPLLPSDATFPTHTETSRGQRRQRAQKRARQPCGLILTQVCCMQISLRQGMKTDSGTLMCLCEKTDNDIRACINTLQVECRDFHFPFSFRRLPLHHVVFLACCCAVPSWTRLEAGGPQDHPVRLSGTEGPEQRLVLPVAGDLPATTN